MSGLLMIGIIGFGTVSVSGRTLVPLPPARIVAFIARPYEKLWTACSTDG